jgi:hypothetical protein
VSGGASSWTAGTGSFGITAKTSGGSSTGANSGSWGTGTGSFGMKAQPGGIWRESVGGSMGTPNTAPTQSAAAKGLVSAEPPGLATEGPATLRSPGGARSGGILASRSPAGAHPASGARSGASSDFRSGGNRSVGGKLASIGAHHQPGTKSHAGPNHGSGSSGSHAKTKPPSAFTPSGSSTMGGMHQPGSGREPIP